MRNGGFCGHVFDDVSVDWWIQTKANYSVSFTASWSVRLTFFSTLLLIKSKMSQSAVCINQSQSMRAKSVIKEEERAEYSSGWLIFSDSRVVRNRFYLNVSYVWLDSRTMRTCFEVSITYLAVWIPAACGSLSVFFPDCWLISSSWFQQQQTFYHATVPSFALSLTPASLFLDNLKWTRVWIFTVNLSRANEGSKSVALRNAAGAKELISSAGSQPPGACVQSEANGKPCWVEVTKAVWTQWLSKVRCVWDDTLQQFKGPALQCWEEAEKCTLKHRPSVHTLPLAPVREICGPVRTAACAKSICMFQLFSLQSWHLAWLNFGSCGLICANHAQ